MFRPCIDLHDGKVKQIVGGSLRDDNTGLRTNFVAEKPPTWFAEQYRKDSLTGGHVIKLGPGNDLAAREALSGFAGGLQIGGGINLDNAQEWLQAGASHVIVTSWVFREGRIDFDRIKSLVDTIGREHLVLDLSCRQRDGKYWVVTDRWQKFTDYEVTAEHLSELSGYCDEFLIHAADVEGLCQGVDLDLIAKLAAWSPIDCTYAGGAKSLDDLKQVCESGKGRIHLTIGSALDIFGGSIPYADVVAFNQSLTIC